MSDFSRVTVMMSEEARVDGKPVYMALLELLRSEGVTRAIAVRGIAGIDGDGHITSSSVMSLSFGLPVQVEWFDENVRVEALMPVVERLVMDGLVSVQCVTMVRRHTRRVSSALDQRVRDIMTEDVVSVTPNVSLSDVVALLIGGRYNCVPVVDDDTRVVGIVTNGDLLRNTSLPVRLGLQSALTDEQVKLDIAELQAQGRLVGEIMRMPVVTVQDSATVRHAGALMVEQDLKRLPVIDGNGRLVGIVSRVDLLSCLSDDARAFEVGERPPGGSTIVDLMNPDAPFVGAESSLEEIVQALERSRQQRVVVVNGERRVIGVITDGDLLRRSMAGRHPSLRQRLRGLITGQTAEPFWLPDGDETALELMTAPAHTIGADASLSKALGLMLRHRLKRLPIVDDDGRLVGVLGRSSVLRGLMTTTGEAE